MDDLSASRRSAADILTIGFGTTVAMWAVAYCVYFARLLSTAVPSAAVFGLLIFTLICGGVVAGRYAQRTLGGAALAGLICGLLNLLIVGSLISGDTPNEIKVGAIMWVPGTLVICAAGVAIGALIGRIVRSPHAPDWPGQFNLVAAFATFVLLGAGGLVTGYDEGLAVVDWPNTEGYNMFLYPLSRMTGGVYLEHTHRLLGSLVGLTVLVLAIHTALTEQRRWVSRVTWLALAFVIVQGILGGLRVTGRFTLSTQPADTDPSVVLAVIHGVFGQIVFGLLVALAVWRSRAWRQAPDPQIVPAAGTDRLFGYVFIVLIFVQLIFGALVRHFTWALALPEMRYGLEMSPDELNRAGTWALHLHITIAAVVALVAVGVAVRALGLYRGIRPLPRLGQTLLALVTVQIVLGILALVVTGNDAPDRRPDEIDVAITTLHQLVGAALLAWGVMILLWNYRLASAQTR